MIILRCKDDGQLVTLREGAYEVGDAFIEPLQCYYKDYYERVDQSTNETDTVAV